MRDQAKSQGGRSTLYGRCAGRATWVRVVCVAVLTSFLAWLTPVEALAQAEGGPPGVDGAQVVISKCVECHTLRPVFRANYDREEWNDAMARMIKEGLEIDDAQRWAAIDFLVEQTQVPEAERSGQPHFALVHFPIALVSVWGLIEFIALLRRRRSEGTAVATRWLAWLTVAGTLAALLTGFRLEHDRTTMPATMAWHLNTGMAAFALVLAAALLREAVGRWSGRGWKVAYAAALASAVAMVSLTGHFGGLLVHGDVLKAWFGG